MCREETYIHFWWFLDICWASSAILYYRHKKNEWHSTIDKSRLDVRMIDEYGTLRDYCGKIALLLGHPAVCQLSPPRFSVCPFGTRNTGAWDGILSLSNCRINLLFSTGIRRSDNSLFLPSLSLTVPHWSFVFDPWSSYFFSGLLVMSLHNALILTWFPCFFIFSHKMGNGGSAEKKSRGGRKQPPTKEQLEWRVRPFPMYSSDNRRNSRKKTKICTTSKIKSYSPPLSLLKTVRKTVILVFLRVDLFIPYLSSRLQSKIQEWNCRARTNTRQITLTRTMWMGFTRTPNTFTLLHRLRCQEPLKIFGGTSIYRRFSLILRMIWEEKVEIIVMLTNLVEGTTVRH